MWSPDKRSVYADHFGEESVNIAKHWLHWKTFSLSGLYW